MNVQEANDRAMARYRAGVTIELTAENALHVTLNGEHTVNNMTAFASALHVIIGRNEAAHAALGERKPETVVAHGHTMSREVGGGWDGT